MIIQADKNMINDLILLWKEAFQDEENYILNYINHYFDKIMVYTENNFPVAMLSLLDAEIKINGENKSCKYIYAVATKENHRGKGISSKLMEHVKSIADKNDEILVLVPASESLFEFYRKFGFCESFYIFETNYSLEKIKPNNNFMFNISELKEEEYLKIRNKAFDNDGYISWDLKHIKYALNLENRFYKKITIKSQDYIIYYYIYNQGLYIIETSLTPDILETVIFYLSKEYIIKNAFVRMKTVENKTNRRFAMLYSRNKIGLNKNAYINLVLD